jgi:hypothetical protein
VDQPRRIGGIAEQAALAQPAFHPGRGRAGGGFEFGGERGIRGVLEMGAEGDQEQRCRVDRAVVAGIRHLPEPAQLSGAQLMRDLAGFLATLGPVLPALVRRQCPQGRRGEIGCVGQRGERSDQAVPAEQGQEPRRARAGDLRTGHAGCRDHQRAERFESFVDGLAQYRIGEIGSGEIPEIDRARLVEEVAYPQSLDEAGFVQGLLTEDDIRRTGSPHRWRHEHDDGGYRVPPGRQRPRPRGAFTQFPARQMPGVLDEQATVCGDVTGLAGDQEGRARDEDFVVRHRFQPVGARPRRNGGTDATASTGVASRTAFQRQVPGVPDVGQHLEYPGPADVPGAGLVPVGLADVHVSQLGSDLGQGVREIVLLDVHMVGVRRRS